jgi:hypothetical protein
MRDVLMLAIGFLLGVPTGVIGTYLSSLTKRPNHA